MTTKRFSVRFPPHVHEGLMEHKRETDVPTNKFVIRAVVEKLKREGVKVAAAKRAPARSA